MSPCPCGSNNDYLACCGLYINGKMITKTPEALMRSRYTAYSLANMDYIKKTMQGQSLEGFNEDEATHWARSIQWIGLRIVNTHHDDINENLGFVEFIATYQDKKTIKTLHENSEFCRFNGQWFYIDGKTFATQPQWSRNAPCPCGSKMKFKNCHAPREG